MKFLVYFTTRPCRSVPFRCYDEKYYFRCFILPEILFFTLNKVCAQQRRAESPKGIQPRAAPWVTLNQVISALRTSTSLAPFALTARQLVTYR